MEATKKPARGAWVELADSPVPEVSTLSPMSSLANDLMSTARLVEEPLRRRLSLCSQPPSPAPSPLQLVHRRGLRDENCIAEASAPRSPLGSQNILGSPARLPRRPSVSGFDFSGDDSLFEFLSPKAGEDKENGCTDGPAGFSALLSGRILGPPRTPSTSAKRSLHRSLSVDDFNTPTSSKAASARCDAENSRPFKRPEPLGAAEAGPPDAKRRRQLSPTPTPPKRCALAQSSLLNFGFQKSPKFQRSFSDTDAIIKNSVERSSADSLLVGDFSRSFALPLTMGKHSDLKTITPQTLAALLRGQFSSQVETFEIVDCRYPYEFNGGHIRGARNLFTRQLVDETLLRTPPLPAASRHLLIFHCEFSSERAPTLSRYLRNSDRQANKECYPQLHYPEMYLLHGGYKAFYEAHPELCEPRAYVPMLNRGNEADLRHFRAKSRSWAGPAHPHRPLPPTFKRLDV